MLNVVTREEAVRIILEKIPEAADVETVGLPDALDKVVAEDILSPEDLPAYARSTVDGFAVRASDTYGCSEALPAMVTYAGKVLMGETRSVSCRKAPACRSRLAARSRKEPMRSSWSNTPKIWAMNSATC